jgi:hypothetical protein
LISKNKVHRWQIEAYRKKKRVSRSKFVLEATKAWKEVKEREKLIKIYEEGYKRVPENLVDIQAWEKAALSSFSKEEW